MPIPQGRVDRGEDATLTIERKAVREPSSRSPVREASSLDYRGKMPLPQNAAHTGIERGSVREASSLENRPETCLPRREVMMRGCCKGWAARRCCDREMPGWGLPLGSIAQGQPKLSLPVPVIKSRDAGRAVNNSSLKKED